MRCVRGWILAGGLLAAVSSVTNAQDITSRNGDVFGPIKIWNASYYRPRQLLVYRQAYDGPLNRQLNELGEKMRALGMQGGLPPLYLPVSGDGSFAAYGSPRIGIPSQELTSPLYHPASASTEPNIYYDAAFNGIAGTPSPAAAANGWGFSPPWSKAYRQGQPRQHKLFGRLRHDD